MIKKFINAQIFSAKDIADILNVDIECIYKCIREDKLIAHKIGGSVWRITESDFEEFLIQSRFSKKGRV